MNTINPNLHMKALKKLYNMPLSSNRSGALYNAFSYPTKISPEAVAIFIACHTDIDATILDPFAGSGTTGLATKLCDVPTPYMIETCKSLGLKPKWGKRNAILYEISPLGAFVSSIMCNPPNASSFEKIATELIDQTEIELKSIYSVLDDTDNVGTLRYLIWSEILSCSKCKNEISFWDVAVKKKPLGIEQIFTCPVCNHQEPIAKVPRVMIKEKDEVLGKEHVSKKRIPVKIYGRTGRRSWSRLVTKEDIKYYKTQFAKLSTEQIPKFKFKWGGLYRKGYHAGVTHLHHFYTKRNAVVFATLWKNIDKYPREFHDPLKLLLLSYNSSHSTLMTRVVVKQNSPDFVITGAQSGVLYISNLPIEKNIIEGLRRKIRTLKGAFSLIENSNSTVQVINESSTQLKLKKDSVDYVFTDPPFGDYIPYSEINQLNEAWLGKVTNSLEEAIVSISQNKGIREYQMLMQRVFSEISRVLKKNGNASVVFHSAKADVWQALICAYQNANLGVIMSSILDKTQNSFKQTNSDVKVQGDPLILLRKSNVNLKRTVRDTSQALIAQIISKAFISSKNLAEQQPERLFSRYVNACLESGNPVQVDAKRFYSMMKEELPKHQFSI